MIYSKPRFYLAWLLLLCALSATAKKPTKPSKAGTVASAKSAKSTKSAQRAAKPPKLNNATAAAPALALSAATGIATAKPATQTVLGHDFIVAVVDSTPITNHDVNARLPELRNQLKQQAQPVPTGAALLSLALERLITEKALLQFALESGVSIDDEAVDQAEQRFAIQNQTSVSALHKKIVADGSSVERFRQMLREQLTVQRLTERYVPARIKVSDADIDQGLRERQDASLNINPDIELGHILIAVPENASDDAAIALQAKALTALANLKRGEDFARVAKEFGDNPERDKGGLMGVRPASRYPTLFVDTTKNLRVGEVAPLVRSGAGFHILKLVSKQASAVATVTQTRPRHILLRPSGQLSPSAARAQLAEFKRQIEAGRADFAKLARQYSQDGSAGNGGDLGWVSPGMFVPEFEEVMNRLQRGQIADPMISRFGVHLIQVLERREEPISERELRDLIRNNLREKKFDETYQLWAQEIRGRAYVEYRDAPQ